MQAIVNLSEEKLLQCDESDAVVVVRSCWWSLVGTPLSLAEPKPLMPEMALFGHTFGT